MDKERKPIVTDEGYSERQMDIAVDQAKLNDQTKGGSIFDPKNSKKKNKSTIDSNTQ